MRHLVKRLGFNITQINNKSLLPLMKPYSKQSCLIDTLSVVRSLEAKGFPTKQAEAIAFVIARSLNDCSNKVSATLVSKVEMQQYMTLREERLSAFKCELQALQNIVLPVEYVCGRMTHHLHAIFVIQTLSNNCFMQHIRSKRILMLQKETDKFRSDLEKQTKALGRDIEMMHDKYLASQAARTNFCNKLEREVSASKALRHAKMSYEAEVNGVDDYAALKYFAVSVGFVLLMLL